MTTGPSETSATRTGHEEARPYGGPELTENEVAWIEFLRMIGQGRDPAPTLRRVQLLRRVCDRHCGPGGAGGSAAPGFPGERGRSGWSAWSDPVRRRRPPHRPR